MAVIRQIRHCWAAHGTRIRRGIVQVLQDPQRPVLQETLPGVTHTHTCVCVRACVCVYTWRCCDCTVVHGEGSLRLNNEVLPFMISRLVKRHLIVAHSVGLTAKHMRVSTVHVWLDGIKWQ